MTCQPSRVTWAEISDVLTTARAAVQRYVSVRERIAHFERRAELLSRIAADLDTPEGYAVAAEAWGQLAALANELRGRVEAGPGQ